MAAGYSTEIKNLESKKDADYASNIDAARHGRLPADHDGRLQHGRGHRAKAGENPDIAFSIVDFAYDPAIPNITGIVFATEQAGMLAGYLAAGVSTTGKIGTYGGLPIPPVTVFMDGLFAGIKYYDQRTARPVSLLGWDAGAQQGVMAPADNPWDNTDFGNQQAQAFFQEGADSSSRSPAARASALHRGQAGPG